MTIASTLADDRDALVAGVERTRTRHLEHLRTPALILQGTRDTFGSPEDLRTYKLSSAIRIAWRSDSCADRNAAISRLTFSW